MIFIIIWLVETEGNTFLENNGGENRAANVDEQNGREMVKNEGISKNSRNPVVGCLW